MLKAVVDPLPVTVAVPQVGCPVLVFHAVLVAASVAVLDAMG